MNKKGIAPLVIGGVALIALLLVVLFLRTVGANSEITSTTPVTSGCKEIKNIPVSIKGSVFVKDDAFWGVTVIPERVEVAQVTGGGNPLGVFSSDYTWRIRLIDSFTGNDVAEDSGKNNHPGSSTLIEDKYTINFLIPDNNCDGRVDNFEGSLMYDLRNDNGETSQIKQNINFQNGVYVR